MSELEDRETCIVGPFDRPALIYVSDGAVYYVTGATWRADTLSDYDRAVLPALLNLTHARLRGEQP